MLPKPTQSQKSRQHTMRAQIIAGMRRSSITIPCTLQVGIPHIMPPSLRIRSSMASTSTAATADPPFHCRWIYVRSRPCMQTERMIAPICRESKKPPHKIPTGSSCNESKNQRPPSHFRKMQWLYAHLIRSMEQAAEKCHYGPPPCNRNRGAGAPLRRNRSFGMRCCSLPQNGKNLQALATVPPKPAAAFPHVERQQRGVVVVQKQP
jgi:hypothetical protein